MCTVRNLIVIILVIFLVNLPQGVAASSWNPISWFEQEPKKSVAIGYWHTYLQQLQKSNYYAYAKNAQKACLQEATYFANYACKHPGQTAAVGCIATIMGSVHYFSGLQTSLQKNDVWALWKQDDALEQLRTTYDVQVAQELLHAIQVRYIKLYNITDFVGPIRAFMDDVESEIRDLKRYRRCAQWLQNIGLQRCVALPLYNETHERIARLEALKVVCVQWLSKTKLGIAF